jgi:hypothetical protein
VDTLLAVVRFTQWNLVDILLVVAKFTSWNLAGILVMEMVAPHINDATTYLFSWLSEAWISG